MCKVARLQFLQIEISTEIVLRGEEQQTVVCVHYCYVGTANVCIISLTTCLSYMLERERERENRGYKNSRSFSMQAVIDTTFQVINNTDLYT